MSDEVARELIARLGSDIVPDFAKAKNAIANILSVLTETGYVILKKEISVDGSRAQEFSGIIAPWVTGVSGVGSEDPISTEDIAGQQILQNLASAGWIVIPPQ